MRKVCLFYFTTVICIITLDIFFFNTQIVFADGGYLAGYETSDPKPSALSWWSTFAYLVSLFVIFLFIATLAYFVSKFLGGRFKGQVSTKNGSILFNLPLGPGRFVCVIEIVGHVFILGISEHSINLIQEITDEGEMEHLKQKALDQRENAFLESQFTSLEALAKRIPSLFKKGDRM